MSYHPLERESVNINTDDDMKSLQRLRMASSVLDGDTGCTDANVLLPFYERVDLEESRASVLGDIEAILRRRGRREGSTKIMVMATLLFDEYSSRWAQEFNLVDYKLLALGCMCIAWKQQDGSEPSDIKDLLPKWSRSKACPRFSCKSPQMSIATSWRVPSPLSRIYSDFCYQILAAAAAKKIPPNCCSLSNKGC